MAKRTLLVAVFILSFFLRIYKLGQYPVGFLWDEASLGYNAYSILKTGRDEYGKVLPFIFKSFGDYKPGFYVYLTIPFVATLGLNEFAVRLPSAILGALTVVLVYFLINECFSSESARIKSQLNPNALPIIASLLLAASPWHLNFSRGAWELNVMLFEIVSGFLLILKYLNSKKSWQLFLAFIVFILSLFTYQSAKLLVPILLAGFIFFYRKEISRLPVKTKYLFLAAVLVGFFLFNLLTILGGEAGRLKVMSIFSYPRLPQETEMIKKQDNQSRLHFAVYHSSPIFFLRSILGRYFNYFSGRFLFFEGDWSNMRNSVIYHGVMYYMDFLFLVIGLSTLLAKKRNNLENFMLFWLIIAPFPAALTRDSISSVRSFTMVVPLVYTIAVGIKGLFDYFRERARMLNYFAYCLLPIAYCFCFIRFLDLYFVHDPKFSSEDRLYGYKQMIEYILPMIKEKGKVVVTNKYGQPYIFYLFYSQYDPKKYQAQAKLKENLYGDVGEVERVDKIEFRKIYWPDDRGNKNSLFVGDEFDLPLKDIIGQENIYFLKEIKFLNGKTAFRIAETR